MENNNRETKDYQQPISPLEYLNKRKEKKRNENMDLLRTILVVLVL